MPLRFLITCPDNISPEPGIELTVPDDHAAYLLKVMRMKRGDIITCFDGHGTVFSARLESASTRDCSVRVVDARDPVPPPAYQLHLGLGLLKGQAMDRALQQATELGATHISLLTAQRSNVKLSNKPDRRLQNRISHWEKIIQGACEQSGRLYLPELQGPKAVDELLNQQPAAAEIFIFEPGGEPMASTLPRRDRVLLIGPEGGWDERELALFDSRKLDRIGLGSGVLRAETMPAVALALVHQAQGWQ